MMQIILVEFSKESSELVHQNTNFSKNKIYFDINYYHMSKHSKCICTYEKIDLTLASASGYFVNLACWGNPPNPFHYIVKIQIILYNIHIKYE